MHRPKISGRAVCRALRVDVIDVEAPRPSALRRRSPRPSPRQSPPRPHRETKKKNVKETKKRPPKETKEVAVEPEPKRSRVANDWGPWLPSGKISWEDLAKTLIARPKTRREVEPKKTPKASKASKASKKTPPRKAKASLPRSREALEELGLAVPKELQEAVEEVKEKEKEGMEAKAPEAVEEPKEAPGEEAPGEEAPAPEPLEAQEATEEPLEATEPCAEGQAAGKAAWWSLPHVPMDAELHVESERPEVETPAPKVPQAPAEETRGSPESKNVLLCGDLNGDIKLLQRTLLDLKETAEIDLVLAVGRFLPNEHPANFLRVCQETELPVPVYFVDSAAEDLIAKSQKRTDCITFGPQIHFLGACGIREIQGLTVAYLSGRYAEQSYRLGSEHLFCPKRGEGICYTENAIRSLRSEQNIDVLLTSEWPETYWSTAKRCEAPNPVDACFRSPAVRDLFFELKPRYHVYASANVYRLRKAQQGSHGFVCTSVALCEAYADSDAEAGENQKWFHIMSMRPNCPEKYSLLTEAAKIKKRSQAVS